MRAPAALALLLAFAAAGEPEDRVLELFAVIANGRFFSKEDLDRMLLQVEERAGTQ